MNQILSALGADRYAQHAICLTNDPVLMFLYIWGDMVTAISYWMIGIVLALSLARGHPVVEIVHHSRIPLYSAFIFLCGMSHATEVLTLFWGIYRLDVFVTFAMASVSGTTAWFVLQDFFERGRPEEA